MSGIGSLNEKALHAALKEWYRRDGDLVEVPTEGFVVDLVRSGALIEIQTGGFSALRKKFDHLLDRYPIRLVHPIAVTKSIVKLDADGEEMSRRRSPKRGIAADVCGQLVSFPSLLSHPNFVLEVLLIDEDEVWRADATDGWRRRGFVIEERRLVSVVESIEFGSPYDLLTLLPPGLASPFSTKDLAIGLGRSQHLAGEVAYCLRESGVIGVVGRDRRGYLYQVR